MKRSTSFLYNESAIDEMGRSAQVAISYASVQAPWRPRWLLAHVHPHSNTSPRSSSFAFPFGTVSPDGLHSTCISCSHLRTRTSWLVLDSRIATPPPNPVEIPNSPCHRYAAGRSGSPNVAGTPAHPSHA